MYPGVKTLPPLDIKWNAPYLGRTWHNEIGDLEYYVDMVLPFGLRSSAMQFNVFADGLEYCMRQNGVTASIHYLDDTFSCGEAGTLECDRNLRTMLHMCADLGVPVNNKKTVAPTTCIEFLGVVLDSNKMEMRMSSERICDGMIELKSWTHRKSGTKRRLLSVLGKLVFLSWVIRPGRVFLRRLFALSCKVIQGLSMWLQICLVGA
jgi:hypothetical protein